MGMGCILDQGYPISLRQFNKLRDFGRVAKHVNENDGLGSVGNSPFNVCWTQSEGLGFDVTENRDGVLHKNARGGGNPGVRGDDHLVTRANVKRR
jgi:hypothetical protein